MTILDEIQISIRQHAEGAGSSVVGIGQRWGVGSGIVLAEGRVLTNAHNIRGDPRDLAEQVIESLRPAEQRLDHQQRPPIADPG